MTEHCTVHEMLRMLTGTVSRRQLYRMLEDPRVKVMVKYTGGRRYLPVNRFLEYVSNRVTSLKRAEKSNGCKDAVLEYIHNHGRTTSGVIARAIGHSMDETKKALAELQAEGEAMCLKTDGFRWGLGDDRVHRYPTVPAHCLGKSGGWLG